MPDSPFPIPKLTERQKAIWNQQSRKRYKTKLSRNKCTHGKVAARCAICRAAQRNRERIQTAQATQTAIADFPGDWSETQRKRELDELIGDLPEGESIYDV